MFIYVGIESMYKVTALVVQGLSGLTSLYILTVFLAMEKFYT